MSREIASLESRRAGWQSFASCCLAGWLMVGLVRPVSAQETRSPLDDEGRVVVFQRDILPIFRDRCLECHNAEDAKNDYRVDVADEFMIYVEPGDVDGSMVFTDYMTTDDPDLMMPPASHGGPLSPAELALIRTWISEGAEWPEDVVIVAAGSEGETAEVVEVAPAPASFPARLWAFQGFLHPATVHFPIALLLIGALFVVLGWKWPTLGTQIPLACLVIGAASSIVATTMGWSFAVNEGYGSWTKVDFDSEVFWHRWSGVIVAVLSSVFAVIAIFAVAKQRSSLNKVWKAGLLVVAGMVGAVGHQGGELTYGHDFYPKAFRILLGTTDEAKADEETESQPAVTSTDPQPTTLVVKQADRS